jgi:hypothetical protein
MLVGAVRTNLHIILHENIDQHAQTEDGFHFQTAALFPRYVLLPRPPPQQFANHVGQILASSPRLSFCRFEQFGRHPNP